MIKSPIHHSWNLDEHEAERLQAQLAPRVVTTDQLNAEIELIAGVAVVYDKDNDRLIAAIVLGIRGLRPGRFVMVCIRLPKGW